MGGARGSGGDGTAPVKWQGERKDKTTLQAWTLRPQEWLEEDVDDGSAGVPVTVGTLQVAVGAAPRQGSLSPNSNGGGGGGSGGGGKLLGAGGGTQGAGVKAEPDWPAWLGWWPWRPRANAPVAATTAAASSVSSSSSSSSP